MLSKVARDARPTASARTQQHLAAAMGYPKSWHVVRRVINVPQQGPMIEDRIYAGDPTLNVDMWFNHDAAREAAMTWIEGESTPYSNKGGHLMQRTAQFQKGDCVEVFYEPDNSWYRATVMKRTNYQDDFRYTVHYTEEDATQTNVTEGHIRTDTNFVDEGEAAQSLGLPEGWKARARSKGRWSIVSPDGKRFRSKKAALDAAGTIEDVKQEGDPPWRTSGHDYLGRRVLYVHMQKYSGTRTVQVEQKGTVTGWIADTDVDKNGEPGFVSSNGKPANLFHITFDDAPNHPHSKYLILTQDMEEYELSELLLPEEEGKKRTR